MLFSSEKEKTLKVLNMVNKSYAALPILIHAIQTVKIIRS